MSECASIAAKSIPLDLQFIFNREICGSSLDCAKMSVICHKVGMIVKFFVCNWTFSPSPNLQYSSCAYARQELETYLGFTVATCSLLRRLEWDHNKCLFYRIAGCLLLRWVEYCIEIYGNTIQTFRIVCYIAGVHR